MNSTRSVRRQRTIPIGLLTASVAVALGTGSCAMEEPVTTSDTLEIEVAETAEHVRDDGHGPYSTIIPLRRAMGDPTKEHQTREEWLRNNGIRSLSAPAVLSGQTPTAKVLELAASLSPTEDVELLIVLEDIAFDFRRLATTKEYQKAALIADRVAALAPSQDDLESRVRALGGAVLTRHWLANSVIARLPSANVAQLVKLPEILEVYGPALVTSSGAYDGDDVRHAIASYAFASAGHEYRARITIMPAILNSINFRQ